MKILLKRFSRTVVVLLALSAAYANAAPLGIGDKAPDFQAFTLKGKAVQLSDYIGEKPVYLKFWATWCRYCKIEMPHLQAIYDEYGAEIEVLSINVGLNDSIERVEKLFDDKGYSLPVVFDKQGELTTRFNVVGTPHHILIDKEGNIAYRTFLASDKLDEIIEEWSQEGAQ